MSRTYRLNHRLWGSLDWLFPPVCAGCNRKGFCWCPDCQRQVIHVPKPVCLYCGLPLSQSGSCPTCHDSQPAYKAIRSWLVFEGPIRHAIHSLKYRRNEVLGDALAPYLAGYTHKLGWQMDLVVPVPSGKQRMKERGYNRVGLLAMPLAAIQKWRYSPGALVRRWETRS